MKLTNKTVLSVGAMYEVAYGGRIVKGVILPELSMVVVHYPGDVYEEMFKKRNGYRTFGLLASTMPSFRNDVELFYESIRSMKLVGLKELPLYVSWVWKSERYFRLLRGGEIIS